MLTIFPEHRSQWQMLTHCRRANKLAHALLCVGMLETGVQQFAKSFAQAMLCEQSNPAGQACGQCRACHLFQVGTHPDYLVVQPEETGRMIGIEPIRALVNFVNETAQQGGYRIIVVDPATAMNHYATNALLKILEEPPRQILFILVSEQIQRLPATITSRCQKLIFSKTVLADNLIEQRQLVFPALLALSKQQANPLELAEAWQEQEILPLLNALLSGCRDLLRLKMTADSHFVLNTQYQVLLTELSAKLPVKQLLKYIEGVQQIYAKILRSFNFNRQLLWEDLLIKWVGLCN